MKKIYFIIILFFISISAIAAEEIFPEKIPSAELSELAKYSPDSFSDLDKSTNKRIKLITSSLGRANKGSSVDNRAYLFALAIDLYNSIPPDLQPEPQKLGPDEDVYEPNLWAIKSQLYFDHMKSIDGKEPFKERTPEANNRLLERFKKRLFKQFKENSPEANSRLATYFEYKYLHQHILEQVALGNITIDAQKAPASISPAELNIYQPKHYAQLQEYMESVKPLIDSLTPPWETEGQSSVTETTDQQGTTDASEPVTSIDEQQPDVKTEDAQQNNEGSQEANNNKAFIIGIVLAVLLLVGFVAVKRKKK